MPCRSVFSGLAIGKSIPFYITVSWLHVITSIKWGSSLLLRFQKDIFKKELTTFTFFLRFRKWAKVDFSLETALSSVCSWLKGSKKKKSRAHLGHPNWHRQQTPVCQQFPGVPGKSDFCPPRLPACSPARGMCALVASGLSPPQAGKHLPRSPELEPALQVLTVSANQRTRVWNLSFLLSEHSAATLTLPHTPHRCGLSP